MWPTHCVLVNLKMGNENMKNHRYIIPHVYHFCYALFSCQFILVVGGIVPSSPLPPTMGTGLAASDSAAYGSAASGLTSSDSAASDLVASDSEAPVWRLPVC